VDIGGNTSTVDSGDPNPGEFGVRFRSDVSGLLPGLRFYKSTTNTGTHIGNLWSNTGALLATANFSGESSTGWQQVNFGSPVAVTAGTTLCRKLLFADWSLFARPELLHHQWS